MTDGELLDAWRRHLRGRRLSPTTIACYRSDLLAFAEHRAPAGLVDADRDSIARFLRASIEAGLRSATVERRRRSIRQFYGFLVRRGLILRSPADGIRSVSPGADRSVGIREAAALLGACGPLRSDLPPRDHFDATRDLALVLVLLTTGVTTAELIGMRTVDVDLRASTISVTGRGGRSRSIALLPLPVDALATYAAARAAHPVATESDRWWLGARGAMTASGVRQMMARRSREAGITPLTPGDLRRAFAREQLRHGVPVRELMDAGGWKHPQALMALRPLSERSSRRPRRVG